ncbi:MAG TPA: EthD family reductase [Xanthobacteraceae bacterium]|nr:EthD family reductase [Xanthobacteraceae bacterium]
MTVVCEVAFAARAGTAASGAQVWQSFASLPGLVWLDLYAPAAAASHDPYVQDGPAPAHLAMLGFASPETLAQAARAPAFAAGLSDIDAASCTAMRCLPSRLAGESSPAPLLARFSYVVRYHRPADDEAAFVKHYLSGHPPLLGRLPGIRNVINYIPLSWHRADGPPAANYMLGNEVVFADADAFNAAMASPVRHELRTHYHTLPRFTGRNTHFAMLRTRFVG